MSRGVFMFGGDPLQYVGRFRSLDDAVAADADWRDHARKWPLAKAQQYDWVHVADEQMTVLHVREGLHWREPTELDQSSRREYLGLVRRSAPLLHGVTEVEMRQWIVEQGVVPDADDGYLSGLVMFGNHTWIRSSADYQGNRVSVEYFGQALWQEFDL